MTTLTTRRKFAPHRALIGIAILAVTAGVAYWELFIHEGRIRIVALGLGGLLGVVVGFLMIARSFATVCTRCGNEADGLELAFAPELAEDAKGFALQGGQPVRLAQSRKLVAEDRQRAIIKLDGCAHCNVYSHVSAHLAVWNDGGFFEAKGATERRPLADSEQAAIIELRNSRM